MFRFSLHLSETFFHSKKELSEMLSQIYKVFVESACYFSNILINIEFSRQIFRKVLNIKFNENPSSGSQVDACGQRDRQTDKHDKTSRHFSILRTLLKPAFS